MQDHQAANNVEAQVERQSSNAMRGQGQYHPYSSSTLTKGNLGQPTVFKVSSGGRKDHPEWPFRGPEHGDAEVRSGDGISFWVGVSSLVQCYCKLTVPRIGSPLYAHGIQPRTLHQDPGRKPATI